MVELKVRKDSVWKQMGRLWPRPGKGIPKNPEDLIKDVIPPEQFLAEVDDVRKVLDFLNATVKDSYIESDKLRRKFEVSQTRWKEMVQLPVFVDRSLTYDCGGGRKKTVWSSKQGIETARKTISMARYDE